MLSSIKNVFNWLSSSSNKRLEKAESDSKTTSSKKNPQFVRTGHFYSPIPSVEEILADEEKIFGVFPQELPGLQLHADDQLKLLQDFLTYYQEIPFLGAKTDSLRYYFDNPTYSYSDGILSHCMIRHLKPKRIIEVGSGHSSCMILDTNDRFFYGSINTTFIEPYPKLLMSLVYETDNLHIIPSRLQDVDPSEFAALEANDILFIDSTHVSKINSDVNRIIFEILPELSAGVNVHFHDIYYPFEYPKDWVLEGRAWNEAYLLRAFLQDNNTYRIVLMNTYMQHFNTFIEQNMPLCLKNTGGSIWIRKQ